MVEATHTIPITRVDPTLADDRKQNIAFRDAFVNHLNKIETRWNVVDVKEELL